MGIKINNVTINHLEDLRMYNVTLQEFKEGLRNDYKIKGNRLPGCNQVKETCTEVLSDKMTISDFDGTITIYDEGFVVFRYYNNENKRHYSTLFNLSNYKFNYLINTGRRRKLLSIPIDELDSKPAYECIIMILENRIEYNLMSIQEYREKNTDYSYHSTEDGIMDNNRTGSTRRTNPHRRKSNRLKIDDNFMTMFQEQIAQPNPAQREVLELISEHNRQKQVAKILGITEASVTERKLRAIHNVLNQYNKAHPEKPVPTQDISKYQKKGKGNISIPN